MEGEAVYTESEGRSAVQGYIDITVKRSAAINELNLTNNNRCDAPIPRRYRFCLLPLVIILEIIEMLVVTGAVALTIITSRIMTMDTGLAKTINTEFTKGVLVLTYLHFAQKWRKLLPFLSLACYFSIGFVCFYNIYLFSTLLSCDNDKSVH